MDGAIIMMNTILKEKTMDPGHLACAGDGGTFEIGIQALSGAAERNEDIIFVCYDNEAYMNTGIQRSSATPLGSVTTTTPASTPKTQKKKDIVAIMAAHGGSYTATASIAYPDDLIAKLTKAESIRGTKFLHLYASYPKVNQRPKLANSVALTSKGKGDDQNGI